MSDRLSRIKAQQFDDTLHPDDVDWLIAKVERLKAELQGKNHTRLDQLENDYARQQAHLERLKSEVGMLEKSLPIARADAIEAAAKVAEEYKDGAALYGLPPKIAAAIRALLEQKK